MKLASGPGIRLGLAQSSARLTPESLFGLTQGSFCFSARDTRTRLNLTLGSAGFARGPDQLEARFGSLFVKNIFIYLYNLSEMTWRKSASHLTPSSLPSTPDQTCFRIPYSNIILKGAGDLRHRISTLSRCRGLQWTICYLSQLRRLGNITGSGFNIRRLRYYTIDVVQPNGKIRNTIGSLCLYQVSVRAC